MKIRTDHIIRLHSNWGWNRDLEVQTRDQRQGDFTYHNYPITKDFRGRCQVRTYKNQILLGNYTETQ